MSGYGAIASAIGDIGMKLGDRWANLKQYKREVADSGRVYQRAVADMRAAGLNPALMFNSAQAASQPHASVNAGNTLNFAATAAQYRLMQEQGENLKADTTMKTRIGAYNSQMYNTEVERTRAQQIQNQLLQAEVPSALAGAKVWETGGEGLGWLKALMPALSVIAPLLFKRRGDFIINK